MNKKLKRIFFVVLALMFTVVLLSITAFAADTTAVASSEFYTHQGETFTTTLYIPDNANIVDFELTARYDPELITLVSVEENDGMRGTVMFNSDTPGELAVNYTRSSKNVTSYMPLLDVTFAVNDNIGVGVYDCFTVDPAQPYSAHRLTNTGEMPEVSFDCDFAKLVIYETGDVDLNSQVNIADATHIRRHLAAFEGAVFSDFQMTVADTHYDGAVDIGDAVTLQRHLARLEGVYGNRINVTFYDRNGVKYATKSVLFGGTLHSIPMVPTAEGFSGGMWSASPNEYVAPVYSNLETDVAFYAVYSNQDNPAMDYYKRQLTSLLYSGDLPTNLNSDLGLISTMNYQDGWYASFLYSSDCNYVLNSTTGAFTKPTYPQNLRLTVSITSYDANNRIDSEDSIIFSYVVPGVYLTPTKDAVEDFLKFYFTDDADGEYRINYDVKLISKLNNTVLPVEGPLYDNFEIRLSWYQNVNGSLVPLSQVKRNTTTQINDYVAVATFNGKPLDGDGKIYIDDVEVTAIDQMEIKNYIINKIAASMGTLATEGTVLWNNDTVYGANVTWETGAPDIGYVANNVVRLKNDAVSGSTLPLNARVSYEVDGGAKEFILSYNLTVSCDNTIIKAPENMDPDLYRAIKTELEDTLGYRGDLTSAALADVRFVNLNLSDYPDIASLRGLSYCKNLRTLNISGLHITDGTMNQIATLSYLEAFIARGCGLDNLTDGGTATLRNAVNLKMLDLTDNNFTTLDSVFAPGVKYGSLREVYLSKNRLTDINALSRAPMMTYLSLSDNGLTTAGTACIANYPYLLYLSLANNQIDSVEHLKGLKYLKELRLQNNQLTNVNDLRRLINLEALYLGHNNIQDIGNLNTLTQLRVLYVNDNQIFDVSALRDLTLLESVNVSNNRLSSLAVLGNYKSTLTEIYAENNSLTDFSFINGATGLHILMLAGNKVELVQDNMTTWLSGLNDMEILTLSDIRLSDLSFLSGMNKLVRLDVARCGLHAFSGETSNVQMIADRYATLKVLNISDNDLSDGGAELMKLRNVTLLTVLYADNICPDLDVYTLTYSMTELKYISLENCGVSSLSWLYKYSELAYVDLAGNKLSAVDLDQNISNASTKTIRELYLDTTVPCTFANAYRIMDFAVEKLSLKGITVEKMEYLPYMDQIRYLNLDGCGLTNLTGADPELTDLYSVERYATLEKIDVSNLPTEITVLEQLPALQTVVAVGAVNSQAFYQNNLRSLERLYQNGVECYLYDKQTVYQPVAKTEGGNILALLPNMPAEILVGADGILSDNNPKLQKKINGFTITWSVSNTKNYAVSNSKIAVKSYTDLDDETITLKATIRVYPDQSTVSRSYRINMHILRVGDFAPGELQSVVEMDVFDRMYSEVGMEPEPAEELTSAVPAEMAIGELEEGTAEYSEELTPTSLEEVEDPTFAIPAGLTAGELEDGTAEFSEELTPTFLEEVEDLTLAVPAELAAGELEESTTEYAEELTPTILEEPEDLTLAVPAELAAGELEDGTAEYSEELTPTFLEETKESDGLPEEDVLLETYDMSLQNVYSMRDGEMVEYPYWLEGEQIAQYNSVIPCILYEIDGLDDYMTRSDTFTYRLSIQAAEHSAFSVPVKPVEDEIRFAYSSILANGTVTPYPNVLTMDGNGGYTIRSDAPLNSVTTITTSIGHLIGDSFVPDNTMQRSFEIVSRSFTVNYVTNGGTVTSREDGSVITSQRLPEDTVMFQNISVARAGYLFNGWYLDPGLTQLFSDGTGEVLMPAYDLTLYAKWTAHSLTLYFNPNGGSVSFSSKTVLCDQPVGELPSVSKQYHTFTGWLLDDNRVLTESSVFTDAVDHTAYAQWRPNSFTVTFNANGGSCSFSSKTATYGCAIGDLPSANQSFYSFDGWYDASAGGNRYTSSTVMTSDAPLTLYAHWTIHPLSDWVLASNVPSGARIENHKWSYTKTTYAESTSSSMDGFSRTGSYWNQTGSGSTNYASFPNGFDTGHWIYSSFAKSAYSAYDNGSNKRDVSNSWTGYVYWHWMYDCGGANGTAKRAIYYKYGYGPDNSYLYKYFGAFTSTNGNYSNDTYYCNSQGMRNYIIPERTAYSECQGATRWFRFDYYTSWYTDYQKIYQFQKVENLESSSEVYAGTNGNVTISNVQHWVRYRMP